MKKFHPERVTLSNSDKITFISNLSTMLSAGIPILETVESLLDGSKGSVQKILEVLKDDLVQGKRIYASFEKFPRAFDKVTINILRASEEAGTLNVALKDLIITIKKDMEFNDKVRSAAIYPSFIMVVFVGVLLMILIVVVPKIATVFSRMNVELPLPTKIMIFLSNALLTYTLPVVAVTFSIIALFIFAYKRYKRRVLRMLFSLPYVSNLARQIDLTRFSRSFFLLLNAGIPITNALELTEDIVTKKEVGLAITHAKEEVMKGKKLSEGFKDNKKVFPSIMIKITEAGEKSGSLDRSMQDVSDYLDYEVTNTIKLITALIEPLMLVFVGIMVGGMMLAIIAPMYQLIGSVGR